MAVPKRKLRRAGEPVRAIVGGGSKSMAKMENKARLKNWVTIWAPRC